MMNSPEKSQLSQSDLQSLADAILHKAKQKGASQAEVAIMTTKGFSVSAHNEDVEKVEYHQDKSIEITVYFGKRNGVASLSDVQDAAVNAAVDAACHIAKFTDEDPDSGLAEKELLAFNYPQLELAFPWSVSVEQAMQMACECEHFAKSMDSRIINAEEVNVVTALSALCYANSHGFMGFYPHTRHEMSCVLVAKSGDEMQRDYSYTTGVSADQLITPEQLASEAVNKTLNRLNAKRLSTMHAPVLFLAEEARTLWSHFAAAIMGGSIYRKSSFLLDHLGQAVFPSFMHIEEQPHLDRALGSTPFDNNGVLTRNNVFIDQGILQTYALSVYAARKLKLATTGNSGGIHNMVIKPGEQSLKQLIKTMHKGLLVTELMGQGVNLLTGDYSRGASGFWVENGEIQYPVHEITIAGNLKDIFNNIIAVGNDVDIRGNIRTGSVLIAEMMIAGE